MPVKFNPVGSMFMTNMETGVKFELGEATNVDIDFEMSVCEAPPIHAITETTFECTTDSIDLNKEVFDKLLGVDLANNEPEFFFEVTCLRQKRRHKKKRINKKWLKRYGYEQYKKRIYASVVNVTPIDDTLNNFEFEFAPKEAVKFFDKDIVKKN